MSLASIPFLNILRVHKGRDAGLTAVGEMSSTEEDSGGLANSDSLCTPPSPDIERNKLINFGKLMKLGRFVKKLRKLQKCGKTTDIKAQREFLEAVLRTPALSDRKAVKLSQKLEPRA